MKFSQWDVFALSYWISWALLEIAVLGWVPPSFLLLVLAVEAGTTLLAVVLWTLIRDYLRD